MRTAKSDDYWRILDKTSNKCYVKQVNLKGYNKINSIEFSNRINIICGLNGAGKTTVLSAIKDLLGVNLSKQDEKKLGDASIEGVVFTQEGQFNCENVSEKRLLDYEPSITVHVNVIEFFHILKIVDFFWNQENIYELIEQSELVDFDDEHLKEINYLVGKKYTKLSFCELEEIDEFDTIPFFVAEVGDDSYDSLNMGMGEYCLIFIYWKLMKMEDNSIVLLEEPESFVGIKSQSSLMNIIAKTAIVKHSSFIISTHSPFILERVRDCDVKILSRMGGHTSISTPQNNSAPQILGGKEILQGVLLVEDEVAGIFLETILRHNKSNLLRNYKITIAKSASNIDKVMDACLWKYSIFRYIGVYDEDQQERIQGKSNYKYAICLPPKKDVESEMVRLCSNHENVVELAALLNRNVDEIVEQLVRVAGEDRHDWLKDISNYLSVNLNILLDNLYVIWEKNNAEVIEKFVEELENLAKA